MSKENLNAVMRQLNYFLGEIRLTHACILLLCLVGICIKLQNAVDSKMEHERNASVKSQNFAQNSIMPIDEVNTIELSTADSNIYYVVNRVGNKVNNIGFINPYTSLEFIGGGGHLIDQSPLPYYLEDCKVAGTRCWKDIHKIFVWLDEVQKRVNKIYNEAG